MEQSIKGKMRKLRRACRAAGMSPAERDTLAESQFPTVGSFRVTRDGKEVDITDIHVKDQVELV